MPVGDMGLMPTPESSRIFFGVPFSISLFRKSMSFFTSGVPDAPFDSRVHVFGIFAEDHHVHALGICTGEGTPVEISHRANASVEIEHLAQRDVERTNAAADGSGQRAFDGDAEIADGVDRVLRQPFLELFEGFFARENFHPGDFAFAAKSFFDGCIEHAPRRLPDVAPGAVAFDERNDRLVGHVKSALAELDWLAVCRHCHAVISSLHGSLILPGNQRAPNRAVPASIPNR